MNTLNYMKNLAADMHIYFVEMPLSTAANMVENIDGSYTLYLNSRLTQERQFEGYLHELRHIDNDDLGTYSDVNEVEFRTHS